MVFNRLKWFLGIGLIFFLILATNLIDRNNFTQMKNSVDTIYKDRLVVSDIILSMTTLLHEKELASIQGAESHEKSTQYANQKFDRLLQKFEATQLTREESDLLLKLRKNWSNLIQFESKINSLNPTVKRDLDKKIRLVKTNLLSLSKIQLKEGNVQVNNSNRAMETIELFTNFEIVILIILALTVQVIIISNNKEKSNH